jgi:hypothetical protein
MTALLCWLAHGIVNPCVKPAGRTHRIVRTLRVLPDQPLTVECQLRISFVTTNHARELLKVPMPLHYATRTPLSIRADHFTDNGLLVVVLHGTLSNDVWTFAVHPVGSPDEPAAETVKTVYGSLTATQPSTGRPSSTGLDLRARALESALFWFIDQTRQFGWRLGHMVDSTHIADRSRRPALIIAHIVLVNEKFVPTPGSVLLDDWITGEAAAER